MASLVASARNGAGLRPAAPAGRLDVTEHGWRLALVTVAIVTATLLEIVDVTIVNVALPNIEGNFGASVDQAAWISTGYIIANVVVIPITPWLQRRFGRKQYYAASILAFIIASAMCGLSGSLEELIFWRFVQGLGGGGLISTSQAILRETFTPQDQGKAMGIFSMGVIVGPTIGPTLGGVITDQLSWRWAFFINVPLGIMALVLVLWLLRNPSGPERLSIDAVGLGLLAVGIGSLQYVLDQGQRKDWLDDDSIRICAALSILGLIAFCIWELRVAKPIVDLRILRNRSVAAGSALGMVLGISLYGSVLILPQYVQGSLGYTATLSGELLVFRAGAVMLFTPFIAAFTARGVLDARWVVASGFVFLGISNLMLANVTTTDSAFWTFFWPLVLSGIGLSQIFVPLSLSVLGSVGPRDIPAAAAFFNLSRQLGGSIAVAVLVTMLAREQATHTSELAAGASLSRVPVSQFIRSNGGGQTAAADLNRYIEAQAAVLSYADTARAVGAISLALAPLAVFMRRPRPAGAMVAE